MSASKIELIELNNILHISRLSMDDSALFGIYLISTGKKGDSMIKSYIS